MRIVEKKGLISLIITIVHSVLVVGINEILNRQNENVTVIFVNLQRGIKMTLKQVVKKLRNDKLFQKIYNKWKKRRSRYEDKISLEDARKESLLEYYSLCETIRLVKPNLNPDDYDNYVNNELAISKRQEEPEKTDPFIVVAGQSMRDSKWREMIAKQREAGTSPTITPDQELRKYLLSHFKDDR